MTSVFPLALPLHRDDACQVDLLGIVIATEEDTFRYSLDVQHDKCTNISHTDTKTNLPVDGPLKYVSNAAGDSPLLLCVPTTYNKLKLLLNVALLGVSDDKSLVILKTSGTDTDMALLKAYLDLNDYYSEARGISKIAYSKLLLDEETVIVNDHLNPDMLLDLRVNVSVWELSHSDAKLMFSFQLYVELPAASASGTPVFPKTGQFAPQVDPAPPAASGTVDLSLTEMRKAFNFNTEDGPEFRKVLRGYERDTPRLRRSVLGLQEEAKSMESNLRRLLLSRKRIVDTLETLIDSQFNPVLKTLGLLKMFSRNFKSIFDSVERSITVLLKLILNSTSFSKMSSYFQSVIPAEGHETSPAKKTFEKQSKEFYDWLNKYLSNEKDRPELKLLLKRKNFQLSSFDYLNSLNLASNNQYFNQFLENLFKFSSLPSSGGKLDLTLTEDGKLSETLLTEDAKLYLNGLSRFNSEKLQLRQMIEACRTNEELTKLLKVNPLNPSKVESSELEFKDKPTFADIPGVKLDMIFPGSPATSSPVANQLSMSPVVNNTSENGDQNANLSGILYALGGQGKQGWHKEWVVLRNGQLQEFSDWRRGTLPINKPIDVALASVKPINRDKRQFCFEIMTSLGHKHVFQAINEDERKKWISALYNAGQLTQGLISRSGKLKKPIPKLHASSQLIIPTDDRLGSPVSIVSSSFHKLEDENYLEIVRAVEGGENNRCADCGSTDKVEWISSTFLVTICVNCSSAHRNMGTHISKVRSLKLDNFKHERRVLLDYVNNALVNSYLAPAPKVKLTHESNSEDRLKFINRKYEQKAFSVPIENITSVLVKAVQNIDIPEVIRCLNCGADPNINLQMSSAKWTEPMTVSLFEYSLRKIVKVSEGGFDTEYFVISELLLLHGCQIDPDSELQPEIVTSERAYAYWDSVRARS